MSDQGTDGRLVFRIVDALVAPHRGRILRLRALEGRPTVSALEDATLRAVSPDGSEERLVRVLDFSLLGGKPSDERFARSGRVDLVVGPADDRPIDDVDLGWRVEGPVS